MSDGKATSIAQATVSLKIPVEIEIHPRHSRLPRRLHRNSDIAVALRTTPRFDAHSVVIDTVAFTGVTVATSSYKDVDLDGDLDLLMQFRIPQTDLRAMYTDLLMQDDLRGIFDRSKHEITMTLTGRTKDGATLEGSGTLGLFDMGRDYGRLRTVLKRFHV